MHPEQLGRLWAASSSMHDLFKKVREVANSETSVVIEGETGTGKELVAEVIHELSPRERAPYVVVDCAAIPRELIESEMFGHARGAFTGATSDREGAFESANGGTIFIDELGELPLDLQPRLLRVLEKMEVKRVGAETTKKIDVRVIAATNRDLKREVSEGRFREDLYFRLNVVKLYIPPLRDRPEDVELLAERFLNDFPGLDGDPIRLLEDARRKLVKHPWPGNVRELRNVIDRGAALSDSKFRLPEDFGRSLEFDSIESRSLGSGVGLSDQESVSSIQDESQVAEAGHSITRPLWEGREYKDAKEAVLGDFERGYVNELLDTHGGNVSAAARAAGIHRNILHRMMSRYGIKR